MMKIELIHKTNNKFYIETTEKEIYEVTERWIKDRESYYDINNMFNIALIKLENSYTVNKYNELFLDFQKDFTIAYSKIKDVLDVEEEISSYELDELEVEKIFKFGYITFAEMYKYILSADTKYMYLYEIASKKFDEEYNTEDKQREFFSKLSLNAHSNFADMYINNNKLHKVQEEIWLKKSVEEASIFVNNFDKALYNTKNKEFSNVYIKELLSKKKITEEEYKIVTKMNTILHILLQANLKHITFKSFQELSLIDDFINSFSEFKDIKINRVIRLEVDMIVKLINNYIYLQDKLIELE